MNKMEIMRHMFYALRYSNSKCIHGEIARLGGIPPLPEFNDEIQGPLTSQPFYDFMRARFKTIAVEDKCMLNAGQLDHAFAVDKRSGMPFDWAAGHSMQYWRDTQIPIGEHLKQHYTGRHSFEFMVTSIRSRLNNVLDKGIGFATQEYQMFNNDIFADATVDEVRHMIKTGSYDGQHYKYNGHLLKSTNKQVREDENVLLDSIKYHQCSWPIVLMSRSIQMDKKCVFAVLDNDVTDCLYLQPEMLDNLEVGEHIVALPTSVGCIRFASARVKNNRRIALLGLHYKKGEKVPLDCLGKSIQDDELLFLIAVASQSYNWYAGSDRLRTKYAHMKP